MKQKQPKQPSKNPSVKDSNLQIQGHHVNPVILEIPQQEASRNSSMIKKMMKANNSNIHYSGGFKSIDSSKINGCINKSLYRPESKISSEDNIMNEVGISKMRPKYRDENGGLGLSNSNGNEYSMNTLESKLELLKRDRDDKNYGLLHPKDTYTMSALPSRFQEVSHVKSSLDAINLENIEAKLEAHRRKYQHIEQQYNASRGKANDPYRYGGHAFPHTNINVDKEYQELQMPSDKIYELSKIKMQMEPDQVQFQQLWELKKKNNPKLAEYDAKYQEYLLQKDAKNIIGHTIRQRLFQWDKYKQPGIQQTKAKIKPKAARSIPKDTSPNGKKRQDQAKDQSVQKYGPDGLVSIKDLKDVIATRDDKFIASYIFTQLDTDKVGLISKQQFHEYVLSQKHIINGYNIDTKWLFTDLDNFQTKRKGMLNKAELSIFLATLQKINHPSLILTSKDKVSTMNNSFEAENSKGPIRSNFQKNRKVFQNLFKALDFNDDGLIKRQEYIENMYLDADCNKLMDKEVLFIKPIEKSIKYRQIIGFVLDDYIKQKNSKLKKSKQYITFPRFCEYFEVPESLDLSKLDKAALKKKKDDSTQSSLFDLPEEYLQLLKDIYNGLPRIYQDYIVSADFVQGALRDPQILAVSDQLCRIESVQTRLPLETLQTTLHRMQKECDEYSNWDSLRLFFSRRGRPLDWDYELILKKKQLRNEKLKKNRSSLSKSKLKNTQQYFELADRLSNKSQEKLVKGPDRYTLPQPFDITDMRKDDRSKQKDVSRGKKEFEELKKQFKAKPVNKEILEPKPLLIMGKKAKSVTVQKDKRPEYNYENYENDRIERALKRAQEEHDKEQAIKKIKEKTQIKAFNIGVDLTKKYHQVIKEQTKKKIVEEDKKKKPTIPEVSQNLYPKNIAEQKAKKLKKTEQNMKKLDEISKRKQQINKEKKQQAKRKNQQNKKIAEDSKKAQKQLQEERAKMETDKFDFKPKIKKKELSQAEKQALDEGKQERQNRKKREAEEALLIQEQRKRKRLDYDKKSQFLNIEGLDDEQILEKIDEVNFEDLLLDDNSKKQYRKQFNNKNKALKELKEREKGLAGRERAAMEAEERRIMDEKRKYKEKLQKEKTNPKKSESFSRVTQNGQKSRRNQLDSHRSKALRRYRALMEDKKPESQWDKYSEFNEGKN